MKSALLIKNVDLELLNQQRIDARCLIETLIQRNDIVADILKETKEYKAVEGILNMLDTWSDERDRN